MTPIGRSRRRSCRREQFWCACGALRESESWRGRGGRERVACGMVSDNGAVRSRNYVPFADTLLFVVAL